MPVYLCEASPADVIRCDFAVLEGVNGGRYCTFRLNGLARCQCPAAHRAADSALIRQQAIGH